MSVQVIGSGTIGGIDEGLVVSGIVTATELDISGNIDVDGHTNLDNVSIAGVTTFSNNVKFDGATAGRDVTFIRSSNTLEFATNAILELGNGGSGDCRLFNNGTDTRIINGDGTLKFESDTHEFKDKDNTTSYLNITSAGNVGINETSPASTLVVRKDNQGGRGGEISIVNGSGTGANSVGNEAALNFGLENSTYQGNDGNAQIKAVNTASNHATDIVISNWSGSNFQERLRIDSNGNISLPVDNQQLRLGASGDLILMHENNHSYVQAYNVGNMYMGTIHNADVIIRQASQNRYQFAGGGFYPMTNNAYDLGSSSLRWKNVYTTDLQLSNKGKTNDVDNTWGDYTIQEGENDLFLINNRNGKKYKFNLTEVS